MSAPISFSPLAASQSVSGASAERPSLYNLQERPAHTILLGGVGGDSHSVGLSILRHALYGSGFNVLYIGTQNAIETFIANAHYADAVLVSCMDGHARHYLTQFARLRGERTTSTARWYLGGNPIVEDVINAERIFLEMGFDGVFLRFVEIEAVIERLRRDLSAVKERRIIREATPIVVPERLLDLSSPTYERLERDVFDSIRKTVLKTWRTGRGAASLLENADFLSRAPSWIAEHDRVLTTGAEPLLQPRSGVALEGEQQVLFETFKRAGVRVLSYQVDSLTRLNDYAGADQAVRESMRAGVSVINGFPVVSHGVEPLRRLISAAGTPIQTRHSTRDPRLLAEISYAGGVTAYEGGAICYNIPYYRDYPLAESIRRWNYVDRLTGLYYEEYGITLEREFFGTLTGTLVPPSLAIATGILESLLAARQGVKCVGIGWAEQGNRRQDIAAIRVIPGLAQEFFENFGFKHIKVHACFHQYMAAFPELPSLAEQLIHQSAVTGTLAGAPRVLTKTPVEAFKIPTMADNLAGLALSMRGVREAMEAGRIAPDTDDEEAQIRAEVRALVGHAIELGRGDVSTGVIEAFRTGAIDVPFAPSIHNRGSVLTARDVDGAVRYCDTGALPFDRDIKDFHRQKMDERRRVDRVRPGEDYRLLEHDVLMIPRGQFETWPLDASH